MWQLIALFFAKELTVDPTVVAARSRSSCACPHFRLSCRIDIAPWLVSVLAPFFSVSGYARKPIPTGSAETGFRFLLTAL